MAEEFSNFLADARKSPIEEKVNAFGDIVEKIMSIVLRIPDLVDNTLAGLNSQIQSLESRLSAMNSDLSAIKARGVAPGAAPGAAPGGIPGGPPGAPPPPPGGVPGGPPPPPGGPPGGPAPARPSSPQSLRGAIMGELKQLFAKRRGQ